MEERSDPLLDCFAEHGVRTYLDSLTSDDILVGDETTLAEIEHLPPGLASFRRAHVDAVPEDAAKGPNPIVVWTGRGEARHVQRLRRQHQDTAVLGLIGDLLPRLAAGRPPDAPAAPAANTYAILCTPRTGSYYLCDLLAGLGFGEPDEHLDQGLCAAARRGALDLRRHLDTLRTVAVTNDWFGTKLISHVLFAAFDSGWPAAQFLAWVREHDVRTIHLVRDDRVAQAVSNYRARRTGLWRVTDDAERPQPPEYDFAAIRDDHRELQRQQDWLDLFVGHLPSPPLRVVYEELDRDPARAMHEIAAHLTGGGEPPQPFRIAPRTKRLRDARSAEYARRFAEDLRRHGS